MKQYFEIIYWLGATLFTGLLFMGFTDRFFSALFLAVILLPGALFAKFFGKDISFADRRKGVLETVYMLCVVLLIEYLCILLICGYFAELPVSKISGMLFNPFFLWFLLVAFLAFEKLLIARLQIGGTFDRFIEFTSERKKVRIEADTILYVESRDDVVFVVTLSGEHYRTKMNITMWNNVLDDRFVRVHRAFIVNRSHIKGFASGQLNLTGGAVVDVSKKYRGNLFPWLEHSKS